MAFFQNSVLNKHLKTLDKKVVSEAYVKFKKHFHDFAIQENIRNSKEEQYQGEFLIDLFVNILGYTKNPQANFNLTTEYKNVKDSKKADGAILIKDAVKAVIELKGTNTTDLNKIETQAFGYKNNQPECEYIITSNFEKLRFYIDNAIDHLEFNLFTLSEKEFDLLYLCLAYENIKSGLPKKIKAESVSQEDTITKKLYADYSVFKKDLYHNLVALNPQYAPLDLFKISQKLLDRFLFIFFAEDRQLLPTNLIFRINKEWQLLREMRIEVSLYERYKIYFHDLNIGAKVSLPAFSETASTKKEEFQIFAYNGGLFQPDGLLNAIKIDDDILFSHTQKLTNYDFSSEVDVNILGHIFENSLNELDELKAQVEGQVIDKTKTKRKKDGVFYTPKYITKYIVENTVGKLCQDKKAELKINDEDYFIDKKRQKKTIKTLSDKLTDYRNWLLQITICDPACGSGAFLNQALDFLISEHLYIDELHAKLFGDALVLSDIENSILENNLFGVDINEESVEIAKLSLWLRTAQPRRKLNDLNNNIKCGNSLIDSKTVAGDKAFKWEDEFPDVFAKGGFDVVIGNPPYVRPRGFQEKEKSFIIENYKSAENQFDLYHIFIEKSESLRNSHGIVSMILPNAFLANENSQLLRKYILENCHILQITDCKQEVFKDASVDVLIYVFDNVSEYSEYYELNNNTFEFKHSFEARKFFKNKNLNFTPTLNSNAIEIFQKIKKRTKKLGDFFDVMSGIKEYQTGKGKPAQVPEDKLERRFNATSKLNETYLPEIRGKHVHRYSLEWENEFVSYGKWLAEPRSPIYFEGKRFLLRQIPAKHSLISCFTEDSYIVDQSAYVIKPKSENLFNKGILGVLNSRLIFWYYQNENNEFDNLFPKIKAKEIKALPIVEKGLSILDEKVSIIEKFTTELFDCENKFARFLKSQHSIDILSKKLHNWHELSFSDFIKELNKAIKSAGGTPLTKLQEMEWMEVFETKKKEALALKAEIDKTDREIDQMVYKLYDLTDEEIGIVEASLKN